MSRLQRSSQGWGLICLALGLAGCRESTRTDIGCGPDTEVKLAEPISTPGAYRFRVTTPPGVARECRIRVVRAELGLGTLDEACDDEAFVLTRSTQVPGSGIEVRDGSVRLTQAQGWLDDIQGVMIPGHHMEADLEVWRDGESLYAAHTEFRSRRASIVKKDDPACDVWSLSPDKQESATR
jgi:hypothetical protein